MEIIAEKLNFIIDIQNLFEDVLYFKKTYPICSQNKSFGGWSITSSTGDYRDGWQQGQKVLEQNLTADNKKIGEELGKIGFRPLESYNKKTNICTKGFSNLVDTLQQLELKPLRCRVIELKAGGSSSWHRDELDHNYAVRLHIPILTNSGCFFKIKENQIHMPADGSVYLVRVSRLHQVVNMGQEDRYHFVCNITDTSGVSQHHKFSPY